MAKRYECNDCKVAPCIISIQTGDPMEDVTYCPAVGETNEAHFKLHTTV